MVKANTACAAAGFFADAVRVLPEGAASTAVNGRKVRCRSIDSTGDVAKGLDVAKTFGRVIAAAAMLLGVESVALADPLANDALLFAVIIVD